MLLLVRPAFPPRGTSLFTDLRPVISFMRNPQREPVIPFEKSLTLRSVVLPLAEQESPMIDQLRSMIARAFALCLMSGSLPFAVQTPDWKFENPEAARPRIFHSHQPDGWRNVTPGWETELRQTSERSRAAGVEPVAFSSFDPHCAWTAVLVKKGRNRPAMGP